MKGFNTAICCHCFCVLFNNGMAADKKKQDVNYKQGKKVQIIK